MPRTYTVKAGDNLWNIAKSNNISLDELYRLNQTKKNNIIHPGDILRLEPDIITEEVNLREERQRERLLNLQDITAIQGYKHDGNYVVIDKKNRQLTVYDKDNNPLYTTDDFATGASGEDYNTITYTDDNGRIISGKGNNSTPAGILEISGKGTYHGHPSFTRARIEKDGTKTDVASSMHWGNIGKERNASNGCVRIGGKTLCDIEPLLETGTRVYTLPEKEGSRFTLRGGKLNFTADNPYGVSLTSQTAESDKLQQRVKAEQERYKQEYGENWREKYDEDYSKRFWDDYNTNIDKSYSPLKITYKRTGNKEYDTNKRNFVQSVVNNKKSIQEHFGLSSYEYNQLAELALGIAEQESKYGTGESWDPKHNYKLKSANPGLVALVKGNNNVSRGYSQIKLNGDNKELQKLYKDAGINFDNILEADKSALATMIRLAYMYNSEIRGRHFKGANGVEVDPYSALLYKWNGKNNELKNRTATPDKNKYIRQVNQYSKGFDLYEKRSRKQYVNGGRLSLQDINLI